MRPEVSLRVLATGYGTYPQILRLNPKFRPGALTLKLILEVSWTPWKPAEALSSLRTKLLRVSPSLQRHECRGPEGYLLFGPGASDDINVTVEAALALSHLVEHVLVDIIAFVTGAPIISGVTGARKESSNHFDVFVECPDPLVARLALRLVLSWFSKLLEGKRLGSESGPILELARHVYSRRPEVVRPDRAARELGRDPNEILDHLKWLERTGFVCNVQHTMNFSGHTYYSLC